MQVYSNRNFLWWWVFVPPYPAMYQLIFFFAETIWVIVQVDANGLMSLTQQLATLPISPYRLDVSKSPAFSGARNPFSNGTFPGNNSPSTDNEPWQSREMED